MGLSHRCRRVIGESGKVEGFCNRGNISHFGPREQRFGGISSLRWPNERAVYGRWLLITDRYVDGANARRKLTPLGIWDGGEGENSMLLLLASAVIVGVVAAGIGLLLAGMSLDLPHAPGRVNARLSRMDLNSWLSRQE